MERTDTGSVPTEEDTKNMEQNKEHLSKRKVIRLRGYDYSTRGLYFVTIVVNKRLNLFGHILDNRMIMNDAARAFEKSYLELPETFRDVECLDYVFMPNHFHCIFGLLGNGSSNLSELMRWWKSETTNKYIHGVKESGWIPFAGVLWQGRFYDHIIRNQEELDAFRNYIHENPKRWAEDEYACK